MRTKYKAWTPSYLLDHPEVTFDIKKDDMSIPLYLEIGCGKGQFLIEMATKFPNERFVGIEKNVTCAGISAKKIVESQLPNAKIIHSDIKDLFLAIPSTSIKGIFLNFSDPWPKKRHEKRRLTSISFLNEYARILQNNGLLIFKTDNAALFSFTKEIVGNDSPFILISENTNYLGDDDFDACTEYEARFRELKQVIYRMILRKK